jgi:hypothetical protein
MRLNSKLLRLSVHDDADAKVVTGGEKLVDESRLSSRSVAGDNEHRHAWIRHGSARSNLLARSASFHSEHTHTPTHVHTDTKEFSN